MLNSQKPHIGIFGKCNVGKSTFCNKFTDQIISITSNLPGTTTDPVRKSVELGEVGPVVLIDTAGTDDLSTLSEKRIEMSLKTIPECNLAILLISENEWDEIDHEIVGYFNKWKVPFVIIHNKSDLIPLDSKFKNDLIEKYKCDILDISSNEDLNKVSIISLIKNNLNREFNSDTRLLGGLVHYGDLVVLVTPIDIQAPKGRLILPQVQTIRDALDHDCVVVVCKERELDLVFNLHHLKPKLVVTDSQAFLKVKGLLPSGVNLTSFSILQARFKGHFDQLIKGTFAVEELKANDNILILESCSHHIGGEDIGRVKIPRWLELYKGVRLNFEFVSGMDSISKPLNSYSLVIQCGGCMQTTTQVNNRISPFLDNNVPVTNYGMVIAYSLGIFKQALAPFNFINNNELYL